jgi:chromosome partitioning protein
MFHVKHWHFDHAPAAAIGTRRSRRTMMEGQAHVHQHESQPNELTANDTPAIGAHARAAMPEFAALTHDNGAPANDVSRETSASDDAFARIAADADSPLAAELIETERRRRELQESPFPLPASTRVVTVSNQKGGVGKTTTSVNVAAALASRGAKVLVIDCDPQGNASTALGVDHRSGTPSIYEVLLDETPLADVMQQCPDIPSLWCVPATIDLAGADIELVSAVRREYRLFDAVAQLRAGAGADFDYIFIDCPPSLGLLTLNAMVVASEVLIPIQCEYYALEGLSQLIKTVEMVRKHLNPQIHVSTIVLTMYDQRTNLAREVAAEVRSHFPHETLEQTIPRSVRVSEAPSFGQTVITYDPHSTGAVAYLAVAKEVAVRGAAGVTGANP